MFSNIVILKFLLEWEKLWRDLDFNLLLSWNGPCGFAQYVELSLYPILLSHDSLFIDTFNKFVLLHKLVTDIQVFKHGLNFVSELIAALCFELCDHHLLSLLVCALLEEQSSA